MHLSLKLIMPVLIPLKVGGLAAFAVTKDPWYLLPMAVSPIGGSSSISPPYSNGSYHHQMMTSPFSTSPPVCIPRSSASPPTSTLSTNSYQTSTPQASFRDKPLDLIKEKENQEAQDLSLSGVKQRLPLSLRSPSDSNIKRSKSSTPPTSATISRAFKHDLASSWRPW